MAQQTGYSSPKAIAARRKNAQLGGPKTAEGKMSVSKNALRHGLTAKVHVLLPGEDPADFDQLVEKYKAQLKPKGPAEENAIRSFVSSLWKLKRLELAEAGAAITSMALPEPPEALEKVKKKLHQLQNLMFGWETLLQTIENNIPPELSLGEMEPVIKAARELVLLTKESCPDDEHPKAAEALHEVEKSLSLYEEMPPEGPSMAMTVFISRHGQEVQSQLEEVAGELQRKIHILKEAAQLLAAIPTTEDQKRLERYRKNIERSQLNQLAILRELRQLSAPNLDSSGM